MLSGRWSYVDVQFSGRNAVLPVMLRDASASRRANVPGSSDTRPVASSEIDCSCVVNLNTPSGRNVRPGLSERSRDVIFVV